MREFIHALQAIIIIIIKIHRSISEKENIFCISN